MFFKFSMGALLKNELMDQPLVVAKGVKPHYRPPARSVNTKSEKKEKVGKKLSL